MWSADNKERVIRPRTNQRPKCKIGNTKKQKTNPSPFYDSVPPGPINTEIVNWKCGIVMISLASKFNSSITKDIKQLIHVRNRLHKRARQTKSPDDWTSFKISKQETKQAIRKAEIKYFNNEVLSNKGSRGSIWKVIRRALPSKPNRHLHYTTDTSFLADQFNSFFTSVGANFASK